MTPSARSRWFLVPLLIGTLALGAATGFLLPPDDDFFIWQKNFTLIGEIYEELTQNYVEPIDGERLLRSSIEAMLNELDPYTTFIDEAENADINIITRGRYGGVGLTVGRRNGKLAISNVVKGSSSEAEGVRTGDIITAINGQEATDLSQEDVRNLLRGEPGTAVVVTMARASAEAPLTFTLTRQDIELQNVPYYGFVADDTSAALGYVKLERFTQRAAQETRAALDDLNDAAALNGLVLDLRGNPGGLLDAAVDITSLFVERGATVVSTRGRAPRTERTYRSRRAPAYPDVPLVVLVDGQSASASEIVAGAVQDLDRGVIVGETTFGKGLVQVIRPLSHETSVKMTVSKYYTPSGRSIESVEFADTAHDEIPESERTTFTTEAGRTVQEGRGIEPDVRIGPDTAGELEQALNRRSAFFFFANHFTATNQAPITGAFEPSAVLVGDFRAWLDEQPYDYTTSLEKDARALQEKLQDSGYAEAADEAQALLGAVAEERNRAFDRHDDRIRERLRQAILARYVPQEAQVRASLDRDAPFQEAVRLLQDQATYAGLLTVNG
ncbi:MAG: PDZ domain-containing protein [Bacteroidetes bacterium]|jgi:carboxyl-terminal processing protease|nr:PDZ domain-containing protein [Bacteroidota bacterium]